MERLLHVRNAVSVFILDVPVLIKLRLVPYMMIYHISCLLCIVNQLYSDSNSNQEMAKEKQTLDPSVPNNEHSHNQLSQSAPPNI